MKVEYDSTNSGGFFWLKDEDWQKLEAAGWHVEWGRKFYCSNREKYPALFKSDNPLNKPGCELGEKCQGHDAADNFEEAKLCRWLGTISTGAWIECETPGDAMRLFEKTTGQKVSDNGCNCCGAPHSFRWGNGKNYGYASGEDCLPHL